MRFNLGIPFVLALIQVVTFAPEVGAQIRITLPFDGYFHPGRCMPVLVESNDSGFTLTTGGAVPTEIPAGRNGVVPLLMLGSSPATLSGNVLQPLGPHQRLVALAGDDPRVASLLFPDQSIVTMRIEPHRLLTGPAQAWETLDAVVFGQPINPGRVGELLGEGIVVAVRSEQNPGEWPWRREGDLWVLRPDLAGPIGAIGGETAYLPAIAWNSGMPARQRRQIMLAGVLASLLLLSALLLPARRALLALVLVTLIIGLALEGWRRAQPGLRRAEGDIVVTSADLTQIDRWQYLATTRDVSASSAARPMLVDPGQARRCNLRLVWSDDGSQSWHYSLTRGQRLALRSRSVRAGIESPMVPSAQSSPLYELARQAYLRPGAAFASAVPSPSTSDEGWIGVLIQRSPSASN